MKIWGEMENDGFISRSENQEEYIASGPGQEYRKLTSAGREPNLSSIFLCQTGQDNLLNGELWGGKCEAWTRL